MHPMHLSASYGSTSNPRPSNLTRHRSRPLTRAHSRLHRSKICFSTCASLSLARHSDSSRFHLSAASSSQVVMGSSSIVVHDDDHKQVAIVEPSNDGLLHSSQSDYLYYRSPMRIPSQSPERHCCNQLASEIRRPDVHVTPRSLARVKRMLELMESTSLNCSEATRSDSSSTISTRSIMIASDPMNHCTVEGTSNSNPPRSI
jgi:hypothetical protein